MLLLLDSVNYSHLIILCKRTVNCSGESNACIGTLTFLLEIVVAPDTVDIFLEIPFLLIGLGFLLFLQLLLSNVFLIHHLLKIDITAGFLFYSSLFYPEADQ